LVKISIQQHLENLIVLLVPQNVKVGLFLQIKNIKNAQASSDLVDFADFHSQFFGEFNLLHDVQKSFSVRIFSDLKFFAESVNDEFNEVLIIDLEIFALVFDFVDEDLEFDSGAVFWVDKLINDLVELIGAFVQIDEKISELSENKLLSLSVLQEEQGDEILGGELNELFGSHDFLFAEVVLDHESMHGGVDV